MKKKSCLILAAVLLCVGVLHGCSTVTDGNLSSNVAGTSSAEVFTPHHFGKSDLTVNGTISLGMTVEEVKAILGQPDSEGTFPNDNFIYGTYIALKYGDLRLTFFDAAGGDVFTLGIVNSSSEKDVFAGGLHVGSTKEDVLAAFTKDDESEPLYFAGIEESYGDYIYGNFNRGNFEEFKPQGSIEYAYTNKWGLDNGYETDYTMEYYYADPLIWSEDGEGYSGDLYSMIFTVDGETDLVENIMLNYDYMS